MQYARPGRTIALPALLAASTVIAAGQDPSFVFEAGSPQPYTSAYLGNGVIGITTMPLGTEAARCFLAGVYDHTAGDVPRIASAPAWNEIDIYNGSHWLNAGTPWAHIEQYRQTLDMYDGVLRTHYVWAEADKRIRIEAEEFVSRARSQIAAARVTITPEFSGHIRVRVPLRNWPAARRYKLEQIRTLEGEAKSNPWAIWYPGRLNIRALGTSGKSEPVLSVSAIAPGTRVNVGEAIALRAPGNAALMLHREPNLAEAEFTEGAHSGQPQQYTTFAAVVSSPTDTDARENAVRLAGDARSRGWDKLLSESSEVWHRLWDADVIVQGDPKLQRTIHSMLFYLLGSMASDLSISTAPMGLSSAGYYGHIFWDADTFMFPALVVLHPELAKPMVQFRFRTLEAAHENARKNGYQGAMYPWEAGPDGAETTPRFASQNASSENHVNGDVAVAAWQYWLATGDRDWLRNECWPIVRDTADFWVSRVKYNAERHRYEIGNVVAVNESEIGVSNDPYTNAVAKKNLEIAMSAAGALHVEPHPKWRDVAEKMYLPASDSSLLWYPLDGKHAPQETRKAIAAMLARVEQHRSGAMMGTEFYPILAAELGDRMEIGKLLEPLSQPYLRVPFNAITETPRNENTNFITGAGAFLQQFVFGYTGLRLTENGLERRFAPVLPPSVRTLRLKDIIVRGTRTTLVFNSNTK
ncbi:MAG: glycoside hydrolase family 65 protein [Acidobacteriaceae bacterium]|nr:glycoside hydrolase family 65 protein [Acidobacteriaceae bacterium]